MSRRVRRVGVSGRLAAWTALLAGAMFIAGVVLLALHHLLIVLIAYGGVAVAGASSWIALTRRGVLRALAGICAIAAFAFGAYTLIAGGAWDELILLGAVGVVFGRAARRALRTASRPQATVRPPASARQRVAPRGRKAVLLMNPKSGGGKVENFDLATEAERRGIEPVLLGRDDDLRVLARDAVRTANVIGMAGGDGSQAIVAEIAMQHGVDYVCVPAGTRNHLALDLGLDRDDVVGALDAFHHGVKRRVDLAFVNGRVFVNNVSLGIYAEIVRSDAYREAKVATTERMLPELLGPRATPFDLRFSGPNGRLVRTAQLVLVSNNPYVLNRLAGMGSRPRMDTGTLGIIAVVINGAAHAMQLISLEAVGQVRRFGGWLEWSAERFEVSSSGPVAAGIDGESVVLESPLRFRTAPAALHVSLPRSAPGLSPAAMSPGLNRPAIGELWKIGTSRE
jgi:diacylglycerol kinase family enzyme